MLEKIPNGLKEINTTYGSPETDSNFEKNYIVSFDLPYTLYYAGKPVKKARCHKLLVDNFKAAFQNILDAGLQDEVKNYGGIYAVRTKRGQSHPSTHTWGIAIDLEPAKFPLGSNDRFSDGVIECFKKAGFFYGGDFKGRKDPMHFQACTGY